MSRATTSVIPLPRQVKVQRALISVSDKTGLVDFVRTLVERYGVDIISTGGTAKELRGAGLPVKDVSDVTGFPEMLDGRVKTLHPKVHGGLLGVRGNPEHVIVMEQHDISPIDLVVVNFYPFEQTIRKSGDVRFCVENIDIGGPAMVRSAAKNHEYVTVVTKPEQYKDVLADLDKFEGCTELDTRRKLAAAAYRSTNKYDGAIADWLEATFGKVVEGS